MCSLSVCVCFSENSATFEILDDNEHYGVYEHDPHRCNWNVFYKPLSNDQHAAVIKQEPGLRPDIKTEWDDGDPIESFSFAREYENIEKPHWSRCWQTLPGARRNADASVYDGRFFSATAQCGGPPNETAGQMMFANRPPAVMVSDSLKTILKPYCSVSSPSPSQQNDEDDDDNYNYNLAASPSTGVVGGGFAVHQSADDRPETSVPRPWIAATATATRGRNVVAAVNRAPTSKRNDNNGGSSLVNNNKRGGVSGGRYSTKAVPPSPFAGRPLLKHTPAAAADGKRRQTANNNDDDSGWWCRRRRRWLPAVAGPAKMFGNDRNRNNNNRQNLDRNNRNRNQNNRQNRNQNNRNRNRNNRDLNDRYDNDYNHNNAPAATAATAAVQAVVVDADAVAAAARPNQMRRLTSSTATTAAAATGTANRRPSSSPSTTKRKDGPAAERETFGRNRNIASAMIRDYLSPVSLVGSTVEFESRKLANTGVREQLDRAFRMHGAVSNSWWTPDDMLYITFAARNVARQIHSLYPVNGSSSY
ncbi:type-2 histone deacetylase 1-like isoform X2 [Daktulosphaira vitifoliae]|uniref:type-2 histone deacetylase 1-like isoform X2 n=1 Tax=Daktulosphaira vitifoliae TaxID=58002 RepID=UPI0021A9AC25|nr:type-2 histone deacetylase 1-like isoform X2 [Daktulosphaira vitifoliae]